MAAPTSVYLPTEMSACATTSSCVNGSDETRTVIGYGSTGVANNRLPVLVTIRDGTNSLSARTDTTYDSVGNVLTVDGPLSGTDDTTRSRYDDMRQLTGVVGPDPDGGGSLLYRAQTYTYNADGQVTATDNGTMTSQTNWGSFSSLERVEAVYDFIGRRTQTKLVTSSTTRALTQYTYDNANRLDCVAVRMNASIFGSPPSSACTLGTQGPNGPDRITRYSYSNADQVTQVTTGYASGSAINEATITYTNNGLQQTLADGQGNLTTFVYDGFDRLYRQRYPEASNGSVSSTTDFDEYAYNAVSSVTSNRRRDGQTIAMTYDNLNRLTLSDAPTTANDVTYTYDNFARMLSANSLAFAYDQLSRLTSTTAAQGVISYQYDAVGRRTRMTWPDSFYVTYDYDLTNAMTAMRENGATSGVGVLAAFWYDDLGRRISLIRGNGVSTTYVYNAAHRLATLSHNLDGTSQDQIYSFTYNDAGHIVERAGSNSAYDAPQPYSGTDNYSDNGLNQYTAVRSLSFSYDNRGNLTSTGTATFAYDIYNRMTLAGSVALSYDAIGRVAQTSGAATTRFLYDGVHQVAEYNGSDMLQRRFVHGPGSDEPLVWYEGTGTSDRRWLLADQLGSIVAVTNGAGIATTINAYDEYGAPALSNVGRFQYTGQAWLSDAGVYHYKARAYVPTIGRFLQPDPIGYLSGQNLYEYVSNNPINVSDPLGLQDCVRVTGSRICGGNPADVIYYSGAAPSGAPEMTEEETRDALIEIANDESAPLELRQAAFRILTDDLYSPVLWNEFTEAYANYVVGSAVAGATVRVAIRSAPAFISGSRLLGPTGPIFGRKGLGGSGILNNNNFVRIGWGFRELYGRGTGEHVFRFSIKLAEIFRGEESAY